MKNPQREPFRQKELGMCSRDGKKPVWLEKRRARGRRCRVHVGLLSYTEDCGYFSTCDGQLLEVFKQENIVICFKNTLLFGGWTRVGKGWARMGARSLGLGGKVASSRSLALE